MWSPTRESPGSACLKHRYLEQDPVNQNHEDKTQKPILISKHPGSSSAYIQKCEKHWTRAEDRVLLVNENKCISETQVVPNTLIQC